jgi:quinolinate synthase
MVSYCRNSTARDIIIVTEAGMLHRLRKEIPGKTSFLGRLIAARARSVVS